MNLKEIEPIFHRAFTQSFSRKKLFFVFPIIALCGLLIVFCRALAANAGDWLRMSLAFLPVFLCSSVLLAIGILLVRIYYHEVKQLSLSYRKIIKESWNLMVGITYLSVPMIMIYILLWIVLGLFYLLQAVPAIGHWLGVVFSFGPFLLVLGSIFLSLLNIFTLFFVTPAVALKSTTRLEMVQELLKQIKDNLFSSIALFFIGFFPVLLATFFLSLAAFLSDSNSLEATHSFSIALQWFFIMLPFSALLTPFIIFFFNFSAESFVFLQRKAKNLS